MSVDIDEQLRADPSQTSLELQIDPHFLNIIINYCKKFDYIKVMSTIMFPAAHNELQKNVTYVELQALESFNI